MKTTTQNTKSGLRSRTEQVGTEGNVTKTQAKPLPRISLMRRFANRALTTDKLLALLRAEAPRFFELAEVVGKWVWIQFEGKQPSDITAALSELGFHWNNRRRLWQHPCGTRADGTPADPRIRYAAYFAADAKTA